MTADEIIEEMRRNDRLLKESAVVLAVQKELIKMGYEPFEERVKGIYDAINNVPKVCIMEEYDALYEKANKGGWIPCSERLPETYEYVLVWCNGRFIEGPCIGEECQWYGIGVLYGKVWTVYQCKDIKDIKVIAWQSLPAPYKKGE